MKHRSITERTIAQRIKAGINPVLATLPMREIVQRTGKPESYWNGRLAKIRRNGGYRNGADRQKL